MQQQPTQEQIKKVQRLSKSLLNETITEEEAINGILNAAKKKEEEEKAKAEAEKEKEEKVYFPGIGWTTVEAMRRTAKGVRGFGDGADWSLRFTGDRIRDVFYIAGKVIRGTSHFTADQLEKRADKKEKKLPPRQ